MFAGESEWRFSAAIRAVWLGYFTAAAVEPKAVGTFRTPPSKRASYQFNWSFEGWPPKRAVIILRAMEAKA